MICQSRIFSALTFIFCRLTTSAFRPFLGPVPFPVAGLPSTLLGDGPLSLWRDSRCSHLYTCARPSLQNAAAAVDLRGPRVAHPAPVCHGTWRHKVGCALPWSGRTACHKLQYRLHSRHTPIIHIAVWTDRRQMTNEL